MQQGPITACQDAAARAGQHLTLGQNLMLGIFFHLADSKEKAIAALRPLYQEHAKMFAPLGFLPGTTPGRGNRQPRRLGRCRRAEAEDYLKTGAWCAGTSNDLVAYLKQPEERYPGMADINLRTPMGIPETVMLGQFQGVSEAVMPAFRR